MAARDAAEIAVNRRRKLSAREPSNPSRAALTADEERFATALWAVHREATRSAVAMSFAGITYQTEDRDARALARKIEPLAKFFQDAEMRVRTMSAPPSLSSTHGQYVDAMALYANAAAEMLKFTEDGDSQHLDEAHRHGCEGLGRHAARRRSALAGTIQTALGAIGSNEKRQGQSNLNQGSSI